MFFKPLSPDDKKRIAVDRDERVFKAFFIANFKNLESYAMLIVKDKYAAEDIASEVMWKIWYLDSDLLHISAVELYMMRAVKNKCLNYLRVRQAVYVGHEELADYAEQDDLNPEKILISVERVQQIEKAVQALSSKTQQAFRLVKDEGRTYKETAEIMKISSKTVDRHIQIAVRKLWDALKSKK